MLTKHGLTLELRGSDNAYSGNTADLDSTHSTPVACSSQLEIQGTHLFIASDSVWSTGIIISSTELRAVYKWYMCCVMVARFGIVLHPTCPVWERSFQSSVKVSLSSKCHFNCFSSLSMVSVWDLWICIKWLRCQFSSHCDNASVFYLVVSNSNAKEVWTDTVVS